MKKPLRIAVLLIILAAAGLLTLLYLDFIGDHSAHRQSLLKQSDAIVVLTGGRGRVDEGLRLLKGGRARLLILIGVNRRASLKDIFPAGLDRELSGRIVLEKESRNTYENALAIERILKDRGYDSIIIITSSYHMKRALFILGHVLSREVTIHPLGVSSANYDDKRWWAEKNLLLNLSEFLKYSWFRLRFGLTGPVAPP